MDFEVPVPAARGSLLLTGGPDLCCKQDIARGSAISRLTQLLHETGFRGGFCNWLALLLLVSLPAPGLPIGTVFQLAARMRPAGRPLLLMREVLRVPACAGLCLQGEAVHACTWQQHGRG